ncbi:uncharacterized protein ACIBXB_000324 [Morphnus guianensis]
MACKCGSWLLKQSRWCDRTKFMFVIFAIYPEKKLNLQMLATTKPPELASTRKFLQQGLQWPLNITNVFQKHWRAHCHCEAELVSGGFNKTDQKASVGGQESPRGGLTEFGDRVSQTNCQQTEPHHHAPPSPRPLLWLNFNATRKTRFPSLRTAPRLHRPPLGPRTPPVPPAPVPLPGQQPAPRTCRRVPEARSPELSQTPAFLRLPRSPRRRGDTGRGGDRGPQAASSRPAGSAAPQAAAAATRRPSPGPGPPPVRPSARPAGVTPAAGAPLAPHGPAEGGVGRAPPAAAARHVAAPAASHRGGRGRVERLRAGAVPAPPSWLWAGDAGRPFSSPPCSAPPRRGGLRSWRASQASVCPWRASAGVRAGAPRQAGYGATPGAKAERRENAAQRGSRERARASVVLKCLCEARERGSALRTHAVRDYVKFSTPPSARDVFPGENTTFSSVGAKLPCSLGCFLLAEALVRWKHLEGVPQAAVFAKELWRNTAFQDNEQDWGPGALCWVCYRRQTNESRCKLGIYPGEGAQEVQQDLYGEVNISLALVVQSAWRFGMRYSDYPLLLQKLTGKISSLSSKATRTGICGNGGREYRD